MLNERQILLIGILLCGLAVALGAFGAHALKDLLIQTNRIDTYELAVRYHFFHALSLIIITVLINQFNYRGLKTSAILILIGILLFSGSLYCMAILNTTKVALITPIGGVFFIAGWSFLFYSVWRGAK